MRLPIRISVEDQERAYDEWGCNCGPAALAAIMGLSLDQVRPHMGDFETKRYTNPTLMFAALDSVGARWRNLGRRCDWPVYGLCRIQWEGPWTKPGVPIRARYRHTHWIAVQHPLHSPTVGIFDVNALANGSGWTDEKSWRDNLVPWLLNECVPRANGKWHVTHSIEIEISSAIRSSGGGLGIQEPGSITRGTRAKVKTPSGRARDRAMCPAAARSIQGRAA